MKISRKIAFSFGIVVLLLTSVLSYVALTSVGKLGQRLDSVYRDAMLPFAQANRANDSVDKMYIALSSAIDETGSKQRQYFNELAKTQQEYTEAVEKYDKECTIVTQPVMQDLLKRYGALEDQMTREQNALKEVKHDYPLLKSTSDTIVGLLKNGRKDEAIAIFNSKATPLFNRLDENTRVLMQLQLEQGEYSSREGQAVFRATKRQISTAVVVMSMFGFITVLVLTRILIRPLHELTLATQRVAKGDLSRTITIKSKDEIGQLASSFSQMVDDLRHTHSELTAASQAAIESARVKSEFLANMSHEIRTPLNGVMGMIDLVLESELTPEQREYLETVKLSADSLLVVINEILDFSKMEAGRIDLEVTDFNLRDSLETTLKTLSVRADEKGLELLCEVAAEVPDVMRGDSNRLRQVVVNLAGNAIKFTDKGQVALQVQVEAEDGEDRILHFVVADTGIGIPTEKQQIIFDSFSQADSSTTRKYGGTGLGLAISKRLVEKMGGKLWVESEVGRGTEFHFTARLGTAEKTIEVGTIAPA